MKFTKIVAVLLCLLLPFSVLAEADKPKPFVGFDLNTLKNVLSGEKVMKVIETEGLSTVVGRMMHVEAEKFNQLNGLSLDQLNYGKAVAVYNAFPNDLTPEKVLEIRDSRGLFFLPADYKEGDVHPSVRVTTSEAESVTTKSIIKPSVKPERDPAELFAEKFRENQERIRRQEAELARLRVANKNNATQLQRIDELEGDFKSLRSLMEEINQGQKLLTDTGRLTTEALKNQQNLLDNLSKEFDREIEGFKQDLLNLQKNQLETNNRVDGFSDMVNGITKSFGNLEKIVWGSVAVCIVLIGIMWRSGIFMRRQFASVNGRLNEHDKELEQISAKMLNLSPEEAKLLSRANLRNMDIGDEVTVLIPIKHGNDTAEWPLKVEKIDENTIRVNIPARSGSKDTHQKLDVKTSLLKTLDNAVCDKRFGPSGLRKVA